MKFLNPKGQLVDISITLKNLFGKTQRCLEVTFNGKEVLLFDENGNTVLPANIQTICWDSVTIEKICSSLDRFISNSQKRRIRFKELDHNYLMAG